MLNWNSGKCKKKIKTNPGLEEGSSYTHTHTHKHRHTHFFICIRAPTECCPPEHKSKPDQIFPWWYHLFHLRAHILHFNRIQAHGQDKIVKNSVIGELFSWYLIALIVVTAVSKHCGYRILCQEKSLSPYGK